MGKKPNRDDVERRIKNLETSARNSIGVRERKVYVGLDFGALPGVDVDDGCSPFVKLYDDRGDVPDEVLDDVSTVGLTRSEELKEDRDKK